MDIWAGAVQLFAIPKPICPAWPLVTGCLVHLGLPWPPGKEPGHGPGTLQGPGTGVPVVMLASHPLVSRRGQGHLEMYEELTWSDTWRVGFAEDGSEHPAPSL